MVPSLWICPFLYWACCVCVYIYEYLYIMAFVRVFVLFLFQQLAEVWLSSPTVAVASDPPALGRNEAVVPSCSLWPGPFVCVGADLFSSISTVYLSVERPVSGSWKQIIHRVYLVGCSHFPSSLCIQRQPWSSIPASG